jgi:hypothetical protein
LANSVPAPVFPQGANEAQPYEYVAWPAWRYCADGRSAVFNSAEEVPSGWVTYDELNGLDDAPDTITDELIDLFDEQGNPPPDAAITPAFEKPRELTADQRAELINKLRDGNTQNDLVNIIELMNTQRDEEIEFSPGWPKLRLAETIVENGGPPDGLGTE